MSEKSTNAKDKRSQNPTTAIIIGSGCSCNIGIPTMDDFMDRVFDDLSTGATGGNVKCKSYLETIQKFIQEIKSSSAYVANKILNIEELYGLAEMDSELKGEGNDTVKHALNFAIYRLACRAGIEFVSEEKVWGELLDQIPAIKRESLAEKYYHKNLGRKSANLLAYLSLATYRDNYGNCPIFVQFNWDLALDRALLLCFEREKNNRIVDPEPNIKDEYLPWMRLKFEEVEDTDGGNNSKNNEEDKIITNDDYLKCPRVVRPHGGIAWIKRSRLKKYSDFLDNDRDTEGKLKENMSFLGDSYVFSKKILKEPDQSDAQNDDPENIGIVPPTWRKNLASDAFKNQWRILTEAMTTVRRIIFIGYSLPKTDVYIRHYFSLALAKNNFVPRVYVWNPDIMKPGPVNDSYTGLFAPLALEGRLFGIDKYFGDPGLLDLNRAIREAKPLVCIKS